MITEWWIHGNPQRNIHMHTHIHKHTYPGQLLQKKNDRTLCTLRTAMIISSLPQSKTRQNRENPDCSALCSNYYAKSGVIRGKVRSAGETSPCVARLQHWLLLLLGSVRATGGDKAVCWSALPLALSGELPFYATVTCSWGLKIQHFCDDFGMSCSFFLARV